MQELFSYSLMASALGILIVFSLLVFLSALMVLIKKLFDSDKKEKKTEPKQAAASRSVPAATGAQPLPLPVLVSAAVAAVDSVAFDPEWIAAATAAYIASEEDDELRPRATAWSTAATDKYDPWVANNKLTRSTPSVLHQEHKL